MSVAIPALVVLALVAAFFLALAHVGRGASVERARFHSVAILAVTDLSAGRSTEHIDGLKSYIAVARKADLAMLFATGFSFDANMPIKDLRKLLTNHVTGLAAYNERAALAKANASPTVIVDA